MIAEDVGHAAIRPWERITSQPVGDASFGTARDARDGRLIATLPYVVPRFPRVPPIQRTNAFATIHARQALVLWIAAVSASIAITLVLTLLPIALLAGMVSLALAVAVMGLMVLGALNAWNERRMALPVIGPMGAKYLVRVLAK